MAAAKADTYSMKIVKLRRFGPGARAHGCSWGSCQRGRSLLFAPSPSPIKGARVLLSAHYLDHCPQKGSPTTAAAPAFTSAAAPAAMRAAFFLLLALCAQGAFAWHFHHDRNHKAICGAGWDRHFAIKGPNVSAACCA